MLKLCTKCGENKPATPEYFYRNSSSVGGLHSYCKECSNQYGKRWRTDNPGKAREYAKRWRQQNPEKHRQSVKRSQSKNRDKYRAYQRIYYRRINAKKEEQEQGL